MSGMLLLMFAVHLEQLDQPLVPRSALRTGHVNERRILKFCRLFNLVHTLHSVPLIKIILCCAFMFCVSETGLRFQMATLQLLCVCDLSLNPTQYQAPVPDRRVLLYSHLWGKYLWLLCFCYVTTFNLA